MSINVTPGFYNVDEHYAHTRVAQITVPLTAVMLLPYQPNRLRALIQNIGANALWIGSDSGVSISTGYKLGNAGTINVSTPAELWAVSQTAPNIVCIWADELLS